MKYKLSIIVPIYNVEKYLDKCLASLVNQTLKEIKIILVNDGSKDRSYEIIEKYLSYDNIFYFYQENRGLSEARNLALKYAEGEYIGFVDSDDYIEPDMFEKMYQRAVKDNIDMVICNMDVVYEDRIEKHPISVDENKIYNRDEIIDEFLTKHSVNGFVFNKLFKAELFTEGKLLFEKGVKYEDIPVTFQAICKSNTFAFINEPLYKYIQRNDSITRSISLQERKYLCEAFENGGKVLKENNIANMDKKYSYYVLKGMMSAFRKMKLMKNDNESKKIRELLLKVLKDNSNKFYKNEQLSYKDKIKILALQISRGNISF